MTDQMSVIQAADGSVTPSKLSSPDRGFVTVEAALASMGLVLLLAALLSLCSVAWVQLRFTDAAGQIARQAARGDPAAVERLSGELGSRVTVDVRRRGGEVEVRVSGQVEVIPRTSISVDLSARAVAMLEPGVP